MITMTSQKQKPQTTICALNPGYRCTCILKRAPSYIKGKWIASPKSALKRAKSGANSGNLSMVVNFQRQNKRSRSACQKAISEKLSCTKIRSRQHNMSHVRATSNSISSKGQRGLEKHTQPRKSESDIWIWENEFHSYPRPSSPLLFWPMQSAWRVQISRRFAFIPSCTNAIPSRKSWRPFKKASFLR